MPLLDQPAILAPFVGYGGGIAEVARGTSPAAGASFTHTLDSRYFTRLRSLHCKLVTSADVADRQVVVEYLTDQGERFALAGANTAVVADSTVYYEFNVDQPECVFTVDDSALVPLPSMWLPGGYKFAVTVVDIDNADQLSELHWYWERLDSDAVRQ